MNKILSNLSISSMSSSDSYQSLPDLEGNNTETIECPICLETSDDSIKIKKERNKVFKCKHAICRECFNTLKKNKPYKCPVCRKEYGKPLLDRHMTEALANGLQFGLGGLSV